MPGQSLRVKNSQNKCAKCRNCSVVVCFCSRNPNHFPWCCRGPTILVLKQNSKIRKRGGLVTLKTWTTGAKKIGPWKYCHLRCCAQPGSQPVSKVKHFFLENSGRNIHSSHTKYEDQKSKNENWFVDHAFARKMAEEQRGAFFGISSRIVLSNSRWKKIEDYQFARDC